jgi:hypothetical protein
MVDALEVKIAKTMLNIDKNVANAKKDVAEIKEVLWDIGQKLCYVIERRFDYNTLPAGIDYDNNYKKPRHK